MIAASADGRVRKADAASVRAAQVGAAGMIADAPGVAGATRSILVHGIAPAGLPKLSWTVVARIPEAAPLTAAAPPIKALAAPAAAALALYVLVAALYVRLYARPLRRLAATAADIAAGRFDVYPFESRRTAEAADLSAALGKIQMRLHAAETALAGSTRPLLAYRPDEAQPGPRGPEAGREAAAA
jgi:methyl-accepting chemotaxis protein